MVGAVDPFILHPTSMSYMYKVFKHLQLMWIAIWLHSHIITTIGMSPDLAELAEI
jgi:hypothetical protein